jgi:hypothetical protein
MTVTLSSAMRVMASGRRRYVAAMLLAAAFAGMASQVAHAENAEITTRRASEQTNFSDAEIADGFLKIAFGAEYHVGGRVDRIRKFDGPVRIHIVDRARTSRGADIAAVVADIRARVKHLDIAMTDDPKDANVVVTLVRDRDLFRTISSLFGREKANRIARSLNPQCLSSFSKDPQYRIRRAQVILAVDAGDFVFYDCAYEELLQALGPINDDSSVPWTMFNDDVQMGFFDVYDQYLLNILYDPRVRPGMTKDEVRALLPELFPTVRAWVGRGSASDTTPRTGAPANKAAQCNCIGTSIVSHTLPD